MHADEIYMENALSMATAAKQRDEVPIGACVVDPAGELIASAYNMTISSADPTAHAEILALRIAGAKTGNYRLTGCSVYTTIEPCVMCAGALVNARISRLIFGASDERFGAVRTLFRLCDDLRLNHQIEIVSGVLKDDCRELIQEFFREKRS